LLGTRALMQEIHANISELEADLIAHETQGKIVMIPAVCGQSVGLIAAMDTVKESAVEAVEQLKEMNLEVTMLTGTTSEPKRNSQPIGHH
jgi:P-type Cu+ transporter